MFVFVCVCVCAPVLSIFAFQTLCLCDTISKSHPPSFDLIKVLALRGNCTCSKLKDCAHFVLNLQSSNIRRKQTP